MLSSSLSCHSVIDVRSFVHFKENNTGGASTSNVIQFECFDHSIAVLRRTYENELTGSLHIDNVSFLCWMPQLKGLDMNILMTTAEPKNFNFQPQI